MEKTISKIFEKNARLYKSMQKVIDDEIFIEFEGKSILITGGTGFIIRYFIYMIICRNDIYNSNIKLYVMVRSLDKAQNLYGSLFFRDDVTFITHDVCNFIDLDENIDYIIHSAGQSNPVAIQADPVGTFNANVLGTNNVLQYAKENNVKNVLYMSSYMVYGGTVDTENINYPYMVPIDFQNYKNCYAQSKRAGEMLCACYNEQYKLHTKIIRPSYIFGSSDDSDKRVWSEIIRCVAQGKDVVLNSNGVCFRAVAYVIDVVVAMLYVLLRGKDCVGYNVESGVTSIREFAQIAVDCGEGRSRLVFKEKGDANITEQDIKTPERMKYEEYLLLKTIGWTTMWSLADAIEDAIEIEKSKV